MTEHYLDRLARTINENWDNPALTDFYLTEDGTAQDASRGNHYTYGEMYQEILHVCDIFRALGLQKGDHIAICGANSAHWVIAYLAIAAYQGVAVTILQSQSMDDIAHQIDFSDAKAFFTDADLWEELKLQSLPQVEHVINIENWQVLRGKEIKISNSQSPISNCQFLHGADDELAMICFTSGSTGKSKGVMHSYRSVSGGIEGSKATLPKVRRKRYVSILPLAHIFGLIGDIDHLLNAHHIFHVCSTEKRAVFIALMNNAPYIFVSVPQVLERLYALHPNFLNIFSQLGIQGITNGGARLNPEIENYIISKQFPLVSLYGTTEGMIFSGSESTGYKSGSSGKIVEGMTAQIASNGEILVKGENVMLGYYKDPEATARKIDKDGWLHTGDKGHLDEDGYLYVEGRLEQDMIVLPNGENIHPEDIERKINALPEASESIVLAREGKLVAIVVATMEERGKWKVEGDALRRHILRTINPELPLYSQLYDVEITSTPLQKTEKQTIKRYLYK